MTEGVTRLIRALKHEIGSMTGRNLKSTIFKSEGRVIMGSIYYLQVKVKFET